MLQGYTDLNWNKRWEIIEEAVSLAKQYRQLRNLPTEDFKITKKELDSYIHEVARNRGYSTSDDLTQDLNTGRIHNSIIVLGQRLIAMDHNPGPHTHSQRYIGEGKFGKVKLGMDKDKNSYAIKSERKRTTRASERERAIMRKIGVLVGAIGRETKTKKVWIDNKIIQEKELSVMILLKGVELARCLDQRDNQYIMLTPMQKMIIGLGIIRAVDKLNEQGIAHRDIKPANILLDKDQLPKDLNTDSIQKYLNGEDPNLDFSKLINIVDWGLAAEIPANGDEVILPARLSSSIGHTAPEYYVSKTCSRHSESYVVADLLSRYLGIYLPILENMSPQVLKNVTRNLESQEKRISELLLAYKTEVNEDVKNSILMEIQKTAKNKENTLTNLRELLVTYPPTERHKLGDLDLAISEHIQFSIAISDEMDENIESQSEDGYLSSEGYIEDSLQDNEPSPDLRRSFIISGQGTPPKKDHSKAPEEDLSSNFPRETKTPKHKS